MNIAKAKQYIKDTVRIYLTKDEFGDYRIPVMRQRPIFRGVAVRPGYV